MIGTARLVILDAENNQGWTMNGGETVSAIASNFPTTLAHGGAVLDGTLYVMDEDGTIYNSALDDPTTFPATGFITAERERDKGIYLGKHHEQLFACGSRTIEFFYNASNATGSPLNRSQNIVYGVGLTSGLSIWENGDITYFIGSSPTGQSAIYKLENFQIQPVSNESLNAYLTQGLTQSSLKVVMNGISFMGHDVLILTVYTLTGTSPGQIVPAITISFDSVTGLWGFINTSANGHTTFPLMAWTKRTGGQNATVSPRTGEGIFYNGDVINVNDRLIPVDTILASDGVYVTGVYEVDVYSGSGDSSGENIPVIIRTGLLDFDTSEYKFQNKLSVEMFNTASTQTLTVRHSNETIDDFNAGTTVDTSSSKKQIHQGGRFVKRNYQLEYSGDEQIYAEVLDVDASL
jgi:hypothetical protein